MIDPIRMATPEEIEAIAKDSDLTRASGVLAMGAMRAVVRNCTEVDPVFYADATDRERLLFGWGIQNCLRVMGISEFYFNVPVGDDRYKAIIERLGATPTSKEPELRYKIVL